MSKANFDEKLSEITAIPTEDVKQPNMPVGEAVQEAENLTAWAKEDKAALTKAGLDWALVEDLPLRAGACRYAQSIWARDSQSREEAQLEWKEKSPAAFALRDELLHHYTFGFRKQPDLITKVQAIREGGSNADMLQDLSDLNVLGQENKDLLKAIGLDLKLLNTAAETADELSALLAKANGEVSEDDNAKELRDRAFTYMKLAVDEIRTVGQYVFYKDDVRKRGYISQYLKRVRERYNSNNAKGGSLDEE